MSSTLEQEIWGILNQTKDEIRANMSSKHINATGRTSASIHVETFEKGVRLVGGSNDTHPVPDYPYGSAEAPDTAPIPTLEVGRQGGDVPRGFYYIIRQWSRDKGLTFASERERSTFAYFLARKIAREGTRRNKLHDDVYSTPVENAKERITKAARESMKNTLQAALGGVQVTSLRGAFSK